MLDEQEEEIIQELSNNIVNRVKTEIKVSLVVVIAFLLFIIVMLFMLSFSPNFNSKSTPVGETQLVTYDSFGFVTSTGSMRPTIQDTSTVLYIDNNFTIDTDYIYMYQIPGENTSILHRLIFKDGDTCVMKGDHNTIVDPKINCSWITKKVKGILYE
jgi:signal peptidase I